MRVHFKLQSYVILPFQWQEAETAYKNAVAVCNECQYQVHVSAQVHNCSIIKRLIIYIYKSAALYFHYW